MFNKIQKIMFLIIGTSLGTWILSFPFRLLENWVMGNISEQIQANWESIISFVIAWILPFLVSIGLIYLGYCIKGTRLIHISKETKRKESLPIKLGNSILNSYNFTVPSCARSGQIVEINVSYDAMVVNNNNSSWDVIITLYDINNKYIAQTTDNWEKNPRIKSDRQLNQQMKLVLNMPQIDQLKMLEGQAPGMNLFAQVVIDNQLMIKQRIGGPVLMS